MKKLMLVSAATLSFASVSQATVDTVNKSGFYLGLNGGYGFNKSKLTIEDEKSHKVMKGLIGGGHLGYQHDFGNIVAGIELASDFTKSHRNVRLEKSETNVIPAYATNRNTLLNPHRPQLVYKDFAKIEGRLTRKNDLTATLRVGMKIAPCWVAGLSLGYAYDRYLLKTKTTFTAGDPGVVAGTNQYAIPSERRTRSISHKLKFKQNGFIPGVYVEKLLNKHFMVGLAYNYGIFKKKSKEVDGIDIEHKPQVHDIKLRLGYKF